jgi:oxygen-independent coproporphyrinogen-3 oxidase
VPTFFAPELQRLVPLAAYDLVHLSEDSIQVTPAGWYVVRAVAMVFDRYIHAAGTSRERFSRLV